MAKIKAKDFHGVDVSVEIKEECTFKELLEVFSKIASALTYSEEVISPLNNLIDEL